MSMSDGYVCFFRDNFFFLTYIFSSKFYSTKRRNSRLKLCEKKNRSPYSFRRKQSLNYLSKGG